MNYNKAELCKDCKMPVEKFSVRERDRELYRMFTNLETQINASRFEEERDRRKIQYQLERIMEWLF
tara:strand:- start:860 stop:1057 length:198 start_codon:yes stop_codon:yes gene_type:complete